MKKRIPFPASSPAKAPILPVQAPKKREYCRVVVLSGGEQMSWHADYASMVRTADGQHVKFNTWHQGVEVVAPAALTVFIKEPQEPAALEAFQKEDQVYP